MSEDCRNNCAELNRALSALELSMQDTQLATKERALYANKAAKLDRLLQLAYQHPFKFLFTALFNKPWYEWR